MLFAFGSVWDQRKQLYIKNILSLFFYLISRLWYSISLSVKQCLYFAEWLSGQFVGLKVLWRGDCMLHIYVGRYCAHIDMETARGGGIHSHNHYQLHYVVKTIKLMNSMGQFTILIAILMLTKQRSIYENTNTTNFRDIQRDQIIVNHAICPYDTQKHRKIYPQIGLQNIYAWVRLTKILPSL